MRVEKQEVAMVVGIVWIANPLLWLLALALAGPAGRRGLWAADALGHCSKENPSPQEGEGPDPRATDEASARR